MSYYSRALDILCSLPNKAFLTAHEAAVYLHTSTSTLAVHRCSGTGPKYGKNGRTIRYVKQDLDIWMFGENKVMEQIQGGECKCR